MLFFQMKKQHGFSLIEMVMVIVLLGILATGVSTFLKFGSQIYVEANERDHLISTARFAIERLNRELRTALPNSVRVNSNLTGTKQCIEYTPVIISSSYADIPVPPEIASDKIRVIAFDDTNYATNLRVSVYALNSGEIYGGGNKIVALKASAIIDKSVNPWVITLASPHLFPQESPTNRLFFIDTPVSYCLENQQLLRYKNYSYNADNTPIGSSALMAEFLLNVSTNIPFRVSGATQVRNATVLIKFIFSLNFEEIVFNNEIQVPNVP